MRITLNQASILFGAIIGPCGTAFYAAKALHAISGIALIRLRQLVQKPSEECRNFLKLDTKWRETYNHLKWNPAYKRNDGSEIFFVGSELMMRTSSGEEKKVGLQERKEYQEYDNIVNPSMPRKFKVHYRNHLKEEDYKKGLKESFDNLALNIIRSIPLAGGIALSAHDAYRQSRQKPTPIIAAKVAPEEL